MRHRKYIVVTRILPVCLVITGVIFWGMTYNPGKGPSITAAQTASPEPIKQTTGRASEPIKVGETVLSSVQESADSQPYRCSTVAPPPDELKKLEARFERLKKANLERRTTGKITIPVYFHIITNAAGTEGNISDEAVQNQIAVLNTAFAGTGGGTPSPFVFVLASAGIDRKANDAWFNMEYRTIPTDIEREAKAALGKGDKSTLNVYTARLANKAFGWGRFPWQLADKVDGIVIRYSTLPGGATLYYNQGKTAVHETGHWLGLYHTFENGCDPGDYVADTNAEDSAATFCPVARNTCPAPGLDPVENYMDFTWDSCMTRFTLGQVTRMEDKYQQFRK